MTAWNSFCSMVGASVRLEKLRQMILRSIQDQFAEGQAKDEIKNNCDRVYWDLMGVIDQVRLKAFSNFTEEKV